MIHMRRPPTGASTRRAASAPTASRSGRMSAAAGAAAAGCKGLDRAARLRAPDVQIHVSGQAQLPEIDERTAAMRQVALTAALVGLVASSLAGRGRHVHHRALTSKRARRKCSPAAAS